MSEDFLGLTEAADKRAEAGPAYVASAKAGPREISLLERIFRAEGGCMTLFVDIDEVTGAETWAAVRKPGKGNREMESQGRAFARAMGWPNSVREPTPDEVSAWRAHCTAKIYVRYASELAAAIEQDKADGFVR